jgi:hypothetical protein
MNYENNNKVLAEYICPHPDIPDSGLYEIKCKNYVLCEATFPDWWYGTKRMYLCTNCDMMFGTWSSGDTVMTGSGILKTTENVFCPSCFETKLGISYPNCSHTACIDCMKRFFYGERANEPAFPYPEVEEEYDEMGFDLTPEEELRWELRWETDYPLIKPYLEEWNIWDNERMAKIDREDNLRRCHTCRA